jgi:tetratricopeptide (TPR) repeat protein
LDAEYLGLVGNWYVNFDLTTKEFKVGEPFTLKMEITGMGTLETLNAPKLKLNGFRVYPPEIDKTSLSQSGNQRAEVKYVIIPTKPGKTKLSMAVSTFSSPLNKYKTFKFAQELNVVKSDNYADNAGPVYINSGDKPQPHSKKQLQTPDKPKRQSGILYLKKQPDGRYDVPLYDNWMWLYILLGAGAPLIWLISEIVHAHRQKLGNDPALRRRKAALSRKSAVIKAVRQAKSEDIDQIIQQDAVPFINDLMDLPPGTTASELATKVKDEKLAECLNSSGQASYMPGASNMDKTDLKRNIMKALKRLSVVAVIFLLSLGTQAKTVKSAPEKPAVPKTFSEALSAYDRGEFKQAGEFFSKSLDQYQPDPNMLFNLGNCLCQQGNYAGALVCFERAHLLEPTDSAITENLNFVRRKLFQPEVGQVKNPGDLVRLIRDSLRPDQWLIVVAAAWAAACLILAARRSLTKNKLIILLGLCVIVMGLSLTAMLSEQSGSYSQANAVIMCENTELRSLPSTTSGKVEVKLRSGMKVEIIEPRMNWVRVKFDGAEGWVEKDNLIKIAPGGRIP